MLKRRNLVIAVLCVVLFSAATANAQDQEQLQCYTLESLQGPYAIIGDYGAHLALALARGNFDGKGNFTSTAIVNEPLPGSTTGERKIVRVSQTGTYTINCDGTGVITRFVTVSTGVTGTVVSDFVITRAVRSRSKDGVLIATGMVDAQRTPSIIVPGGTFLTRTYTRLPDRPEGSDSSRP